MAKNSPDLGIGLGSSGSDELGREKVIKSVFKDYQKLLAGAIENDWQFKSSKLHNHGQITLSHFEHVTHGVQVLFTLYRNLPEDHFFVDEEMLRDTIAMFMVHDYHKLRDDSLGEEEFDISKNEIRLFAENLNIGRISDIDVEALRAVASAHHKMNEKSKKNEIPFEYLDEFYFVLLADAIASSEDLDHVLSTCRNRVQGALNGQYSVMGHTLEKSEMGEFGNIVNRAVKNVLEDMGFITLKPFNEGCAYVQPGDVELETDSLNERILEEVRKTARKSRDDYSPEDVSSNVFEQSNMNSQYYNAEYIDFFLLGTRKTIEGVIKRGLIESEDSTPNQNADGDYAVTCPTKSQIDTVQEYIEEDIEFHTDTRRVEGIAKSIHTIYLLTGELVGGSDDDGLDIESNEEWATDRLMAVMKLFGLYEDDEYREIVKKARENANGNLKTGDKVWYYKYIIGQFVYEKYFEGFPRQELTERLTDIVMDNLRDFASIEKIEEKIVGDAISELASWIGINVKFHPSRGEEFQLSEVRENNEIVEDYLQKPGKQDCEMCSWGTTSEPPVGTTPPFLKPRDNEEKPPAEIETNIKGTGEKETITVEDEETPICFACQLRILTNRANVKEWGEDNTLYAHTQDYYGYNPISEWLFTEFLSECTNSNTGDLELSYIGEDIISLSTPDPIKNFLNWDDPELIKALTSLEGAYNPNSPFGGKPIVVSTTEKDDQELRDSISVVISAAVYSGMRIHISETPLSLVEYNTGELASLSSSVSSVFPTFGESIELEETIELISETVTESGEVECKVPSGAF